jgi:hypothetical protein
VIRRSVRERTHAHPKTLPPPRRGCTHAQPPTPVASTLTPTTVITSSIATAAACSNPTDAPRTSSNACHLLKTPLFRPLLKPPFSAVPFSALPPQIRE